MFAIISNQQFLSLVSVDLLFRSPLSTLSSHFPSACVFPICVCHSMRLKDIAHSTQRRARERMDWSNYGFIRVIVEAYASLRFDKRKIYGLAVFAVNTLARPSMPHCHIATQYWKSIVYANEKMEWRSHTHIAPWRINSFVSKMQIKFTAFRWHWHGHHFTNTTTARRR